MGYIEVCAVTPAGKTAAACPQVQVYLNTARGVRILSTPSKLDLRVSDREQLTLDQLTGMLNTGKARITSKR